MAANGKVSCSSSSILRSFKNFLLQLLIFISEIAEEGFQGLSQSTGCFFLGLWKRTFFGNRERLIFCNVTMLCKACWLLAKSAQKKTFWRKVHQLMYLKKGVIEVKLLCMIKTVGNLRLGWLQIDFLGRKRTLLFCYISEVFQTLSASSQHFVCLSCMNMNKDS